MIFLRAKSRQRPLNGRPASVNERLASMGGFFGALSIIVTGALLYAIFTAKSEDKWYYITAVLINIFLLILLMIGAITFDRFYLKRWATRRPHHHTAGHHNNRPANTITPNISTAIIEHTTNAEMSQVLNDHPQSTTTNATTATYLVHHTNDIPPVYPGYYPTTAQIQTSRLIAPNGAAIVLISAATAAQIVSTEQQQQLNVDDKSIVEKSAICLPPNYYDLYPTSDCVELNCLADAENGQLTAADERVVRHENNIKIV